MLKKDITFIYMDTAEKNAYGPIVEEAKKRGYRTNLTDDKFAKCEIGFYCQHVNFPQFSKFSVIMLHDIIQQYSNWPDIWYLEPWDKYDIGLLPSKQWAINWKKASKWSYSRPRKGIYKVGWPKADVINQIQHKASKEEFYAEHNMDISKRTVLYAPAWENDNKQDEFVKAMLPLDVNILIKQGPWGDRKWLEARPDIQENVKKMYELHKDIPGVVLLDQKLNIFEAIAVSDVLVSEESSTMCEATMMKIPAVSVSDWLIPDCEPSRMPKCDYDFVIKTTRNELGKCVKHILDDYDAYKSEVTEFAEKNFCNMGETSKIIMDIIDDCVSGNNIRYKSLKAAKLERPPLLKNIKRVCIQARIQIFLNWKVRNKFFSAIWNFGKRIKDTIVKKK